MPKFQKAIVVEDNEPTRKLICMALEAQGIKEVICAENGENALQALASAAVDIAIVDWQMEVMDGIEFTKNVRNGYRNIDPKTPILMLTGVHGVDAKHQAYASGVDLFMNKPFSMKMLFEGLKNLIHKDVSPAN